MTKNLQGEIVRRRREVLKRLGMLSGVFAAGVLADQAFLPKVLGQTGNIEIEPGSFVAPASYIIFKDDSGYICAKNGKTGEIDFRGTDAATVIQQAIDALTNGGRIFIKRGTYNIDSGISLASNIALVGEDKYTTKLKGTVRVLWLKNKENIYLRNLWVDTEGYAGAVWVEKSSNVIMENCRFTGSGSPDIGHATIEIRTGKNIKIDNCEIEKGGHNNIYITSAAGEDVEQSLTDKSENIHITNCYIHDAYDDAIDPNETEWLLIANNRIINNELSCCSIEKWCKHVTFINNLVKDGRFINVDATCRYVSIIGNHFEITYPGEYTLNGEIISFIGNYFYMAYLHVNGGKSVSIIGNHLYNPAYNSTMLKLTDASGVVIKDNYFNSWNFDNSRTNLNKPIIMSGTCSDILIEGNFFENYDTCPCKFVGTRVIIRKNLYNRRGSNLVAFFHDQDGTMTGTEGTAFTYEEQLGEETGLPIDTTGIVQRTVTFPRQYPTGGAKPSRIEVKAWLKNPTATDFEAILWVDNISETGFRINLKVITASATSGATVDVAWEAVPIW